MADEKINQMTDGSPLQTGDELVIARSGDNFKIPFEGNLGIITNKNDAIMLIEDSTGDMKSIESVVLLGQITLSTPTPMDPLNTFEIDLINQFGDGDEQISQIIIPSATFETAGLMSSSDKTVLDTISSSLNIAPTKVLSLENNVYFYGTDDAEVDFGNGGSILYDGGDLGTPNSGDLSNCITDTRPENDNSTNLASTSYVDRAINKYAWNVLIDGATITPDLSLGYNFEVQLGGSRTLANPSNIIPQQVGQTGTIKVFQDATGGRTLTYGWGYVFPQATPPLLSTGGFAQDQLYYQIDRNSSATVTMTIATPCVVSWTTHGLQSGEKVQFTTTGALPTGLSVSTTYYITKIDADSFYLSTSKANAVAGTYIATSGSQSGVHTAQSISIMISNNLNVG